MEVYRETISDAVSDLPSEITGETSVVRTGLPITSSTKALPITSRTHQVHTTSTLPGNTGKLLVTPDSVGALQHHPLLQMQMQQQQQMNIHQIRLQCFQSPFLPQQAPLHQAVPSSTGAPGICRGTCTWAWVNPASRRLRPRQSTHSPIF